MIEMPLLWASMREYQLNADEIGRKIACIQYVHHPFQDRSKGLKQTAMELTKAAKQRQIDWKAAAEVEAKAEAEAKEEEEREASEKVAAMAEAKAAKIARATAKAAEAEAAKAAFEAKINLRRASNTLASREAWTCGSGTVATPGAENMRQLSHDC